MKARRGLQVTVGVLTLIVIVLLALFALTMTVVQKLDNPPAKLVDVVATVQMGLENIAAEIKLSTTIVLLVMLGIPAAFMLLGVILLLARKTKVEGVHIAGSVFVLLGLLVMTAAVVVAADAFAMGDEKLSLIVRLAMLGLFVLLTLLIVISLAIKRRPLTDEQLSEQLTEEQTQTEPVEEHIEEHVEEPVNEPIDESVSEVVEEPVVEPVNEPENRPVEEQEPQAQPQPAPAQETAPTSPAEQYIPQEVSVRQTVEQVYGKPNAESNGSSKLKKLRMLREMGAISEEEYVRLLESYLK